MTVSTLAPRARRRMTPPPPPDPVTQYALDVVAGRVIAGKYVRKAAERHRRDLANGHERGLRWDPAAAERAISFVPLLRHHKGDWGSHPGKPQGALVKNPLHQIVRDNAVLLRGFARELGLSPSARSDLVGREPSVDDPLDAFLRSGR